MSDASSWQSPILDLRRLVLFRGLLARPLLVRLLSRAEAGADPADLYGEWLYLLSREQRLWTCPILRQAADPWEAWLIDAVLGDENLWTLSAEKGRDPGPVLAESAARDLDLLARARGALAAVRQAAGLGPAPAGSWALPADEPSIPRRSEREAVVRALVRGRDWSALAGDLARYLRSAGAGPFNGAYTFLWDEQGLAPVLNPDPVRLEHLTGYQSEREQVIANTRRLVQGLPAHHLLLYGDRGTGKSATVKALAHRFADDGLRLVEVPKSALQELDRVVERLGQRGLAFVIFIDDLSFEAGETDYKELKALLEGTVRAQAPNVRVYATSNRRHLIKEEFSDRRGGAWGTAADDVRSQDTLQEKLSLADRFAVTIIFPTPSQKEYLEIVDSLAAQYGLEIDRQRLAQMALQWAAWQNGRSARTARQFIESLVGEALPGEDT